jgi:hypothetical protein
MLLALLHWLIFSNCVDHYFLPSLIPTPSKDVDVDTHCKKAFKKLLQ